MERSQVHLTTDTNPMKSLSTYTTRQHIFHGQMDRCDRPTVERFHDLRPIAVYTVVSCDYVIYVTHWYILRGNGVYDDAFRFDDANFTQCRLSRFETFSTNELPIT